MADISVESGEGGGQAFGARCQCHASRMMEGMPMSCALIAGGAKGLSATGLSHSEKSEKRARLHSVFVFSNQ